MPSCSRACRGSSSTTTPRTTPPATPTGSIRTPPRPARWSPSWRPARACRSTRRRGALAAALMAGIVMDTATFAHPNATPRTLAVVGRAGRGRGAAVRHLAPAVPLQARRPAAAVRPRPRPARDAPTTGAIVWSTPDRRRPRRDRRRAAPSRRASSTCSPQAEAAEVAILFKEAGASDADQRPDQAGRRRRDRPDRRGSVVAATPGRPARPSTRRSPTPGRRSSPRRAGSSPRWLADRGSLVARARARRHPRRRQAGRSDVARHRRARPPAGRHEARRPRRDARPVRVAACCRSSSGHATRVVEYHLGDRKALPGDGLLRGVVDDRRPRGRADPGRRPGADARGGRGRLAG